MKEQTVEEVCAATQLSPDAVYAWRSRLMKCVRETLQELDPADPIKTPAMEPR